MNEVDHVQAAVLKDLSKMAIAGAGIIALLALLLWGLVTSAEAADHSLKPIVSLRAPQTKVTPAVKNLVGGSRVADLGADHLPLDFVRRYSGPPGAIAGHSGQPLVDIASCRFAAEGAIAGDRLIRLRVPRQ